MATFYQQEKQTHSMEAPPVSRDFRVSRGTFGEWQREDSFFVHSLTLLSHPSPLPVPMPSVHVFVLPANSYPHLLVS